MKTGTYKLFLGIVLLPLLIAILYFAFVAKPRFVSNAQIVVRHAGADRIPQTPGLAMLLTGMNPASREEGLYLREYISSLDMMNLVDDELSWKQHVVSQGYDPMYHIAESASEEDFLKLYRKLIKPAFDDATGLLKIEVESFDPAMSLKILELIIKQSDEKVNQLSRKMADDQLSFSRAELANAKERYLEKTGDLIQFQKANNLLDGEASADARAKIIEGLQADITKESAKLSVLRSRMDQASPAVARQEEILRSLTRQLGIERGQLISGGEGDRLNVIASRFRVLALDAAIAEEAYKVSVSAVENSRIEATKRMRSLAVVVSPHLPDAAAYPRYLYNIASIGLILLLLFGVVVFLIASIRDHAD